MTHESRPHGAASADALNVERERSTGVGRDVLTDPEVRQLGYEPSWRGWTPTTATAINAITEAQDRRSAARARARSRTLAIEGPSEPCVRCGRPAPPSLVGAPTCSDRCLGQAADLWFPLVADALATRADGSGGTPQRMPPPKPVPVRRIPPEGAASVAEALRRLGSVRTVLERHGARIRGRSAFCPVHENTRTPAMSLYERDGKERVHCHGCGFDGDALDLEATLAGEDLTATIRRWGA